VDALAKGLITLPTVEPLDVSGLDVAPLLAGGRSPHTYAARRQDAAHVARFLSAAGLRLDQLDELSCIAFREWCAAQWSPATVNRRLSTLRLLLRRLRAAGVVVGDPAAGVEGFDLGDGGTLPALTRSQARDLLDGCRADETPRGVRDLALLRLCLRTGLRRSEVLSLRTGDPVERGAHLVAQVKIKRSKLLVVKLDGVRADLSAWFELAAILDGDDPAAALLRPVARGVVGPWRHGGVWALRPAQMVPRSFDRMVGRRALAVGVEGVTPHVLRATYITLTLASGAPLNRVQRSVGHSDPRVTGRYDALRDSLDDHPSDYLAGI